MSLDPDGVTRKTFETSFRGYDQMEVQAFLLVVADELRAARDREFELELRLSEADRRARDLQYEVNRLHAQVEALRADPPSAPTLADLERAELVKLVGDETVRVLDAARSGAADIISRAEAEAEATVTQASTRARARLEVADEEIARHRDDVHSELAALRRDVEADVAELRSAAVAELRDATDEQGAALAAERQRVETELRMLEAVGREEIEQRREAAEAEATRIVDEATAEADVLRARAQADHEAALDAARALAEEARSFRREVLADLSARRHAARAQVEQLAAAREVLLAALGTAREAFDRADDSLGDVMATADGMLDAARERSAQARQDAESEAPASVDELEAFLAEHRVGEPRPSGVDRPSPVADVHAADDPEPPEVVTSLFARIRADAEAFIPEDEPYVPEDAGDDLAGLTPVDATRGTAGTAAPIEATPAVGPGAGDAAVLPSRGARPEVGREPTAYTSDGAGSASSPAPLVDDGIDARRARALAGPERGLGRVLKRVLTEEQNELFDALRRADESATVDDLLGPIDQHCVRYAAAARDELRDAAYAGATILERGSVNRSDIDDLAAALGTEIVAPLRSRLAAEWHDAVSSDRLEAARETYRLWRTKVLPGAVHHAVARAFNRGLMETPGVDAERWLVDVG